ncbi:nucleotidyltransferase family protein [Sulfitobacter sp. MF3-043]|uniref:nucleotidyltransferase family protein n=1 Tax=Sulfitobacter sediminivivens TaxID=3252902 RepID=UPI0036DA0A49
MAQLMSFPIIILAAGQSRRMRGRDKLLEDIDGAPLLRRQAQMARAVTDGDVIVALPPAPHPRYDTLSGLQVSTLAVADADEGMNASLRAAILALPATAKCAMILLADLPDLTADDLITVANSIDLKTQQLIWRGATQDGAAGHPIVFKADLFAELAVLSGDTGGREVVAAHQDQTVFVPLPGTRAHGDLDTPEQWAIWRRSRQDAP